MRPRSSMRSTRRNSKSSRVRPPLVCTCTWLTSRLFLDLFCHLSCARLTLAQLRWRTKWGMDDLSSQVQVHNWCCMVLFQWNSRRDFFAGLRIGLVCFLLYGGVRFVSCVEQAICCRACLGPPWGTPWPHVPAIAFLQPVSLFPLPCCRAARAGNSWPCLRFHSRCEGGCRRGTRRKGTHGAAAPLSEHPVDKARSPSGTNRSRVNLENVQYPMHVIFVRLCT